MIILRTKAFRDFKSHAFFSVDPKFYQLKFSKVCSEPALLINVTHLLSHTLTSFPRKDL